MEETPSAARMYTVLLGDDRWASPTDQRAVEQLLTAEPLADTLAREGREFLTRATAWVAGRGILQFVDCGAGLPVSSFPRSIRSSGRLFWMPRSSTWITTRWHSGSCSIS